MRIKERLQTIKLDKGILWIFFVALLLRLAYIWHGYPYIFNVDEPAVIRTTLGLRHSPIIDHFDWPHFGVYFGFIFYFLFIKARGFLQALGLRESLEALVPFIWNDPFVFYLISRLLSVILGALTVIPIFSLGKISFGKTAGLVAALILALYPYHIIASHMAQYDVSMLFWISLGLLYGFKYSENPTKRNLILSAVFFAVASGIKYNAVLLALPVPFLLLAKQAGNLREKIITFSKNYLTDFLLYGFIMLIVFLTTSPMIIIKWDIFWSDEFGKGFFWQLNENSSPLALNEYPSALFKHLIITFKALGYSGLVLYFVGLYAVVQKKNNQGLIFGITTLILFLYISKYGRAGQHYFIPLYGLAALTGSYGYLYLTKNFKEYKKLIIAAIFVPLVLSACYAIILFARNSTLREAMKFYESNHQIDAKTYSLGGNLADVDMMNNLGMKRFRQDSVLEARSYLLSEKQVNDDKIMLVKTIDNVLRRGPIIYVYQAVTSKDPN